MSIKNNENLKQCSACGGRCCQHIPGGAWPDQFDIEDGVKKLEAALLTGRWCMDCWEGTLDGVESPLFVRPSTIRAIGDMFDYSWGGRCIMLGPEGCVLKFEARPRMCQALVPTGDLAEGMCKTMPGNFKEDCARAWAPYRILLQRMGTEVEEDPIYAQHCVELKKMSFEMLSARSRDQKINDKIEELNSSVLNDLLFM